MQIRGLIEKLIISYIATILVGLSGGIAGFVLGDMLAGTFTEFEVSYWIKRYWYYTAMGLIIFLIQILYLVKEREAPIRRKVAHYIGSSVISILILGLYILVETMKIMTPVREKFLIYIIWLFQFLAVMAMLLEWCIGSIIKQVAKEIKT